jgi:hypothetical protein
VWYVLYPVCFVWRDGIHVMARVWVSMASIWHWFGICDYLLILSPPPPACALGLSIFACVHAFMRSCVHAFMRSCVHAFMRSCVHAFMRSCVHGFMGPWVHEFTPSCVRVRACVHIHRDFYPKLSTASMACWLSYGAQHRINLTSPFRLSPPNITCLLH